MGSSYVSNPVIFLIDTVFSLYILAVFLRFLLQWCHAEYYNPLSQFLVRITQPPLKILRRFIPPIGRIDTSSLVLMLALQMFADFSVLILKGFTVTLGALIVISISQLVSMLFNIYIFAIIARALLSWLNPGSFDAAASLLHSLTEPVLEICRRVVPDLGGVDLSPLVALILLQLAKMMVLPPLQELASLIG